jgi:hypothetical protein
VDLVSVVDRDRGVARAAHRRCRVRIAKDPPGALSEAIDTA